MPSSAERSAAAVIVAGGSGSRLGGSVPKQYLEVAGEPLLLRAVRPFLDHPRVLQTIVVLPPTDLEDPPAWLRALPVEFVGGGTERGDSVLAGLRRVRPEIDSVLIHDGARPFPSRELIDRVLDACAAGIGAVPGLPPTDTIKSVDPDGWVAATPERRTLRGVQTPQGFPREAILLAHERAAVEGLRATDDAALFERVGRVRIVAGEATNLKVTVPADLAFAEAVARGRAGSDSARTV